MSTSRKSWLGGLTATAVALTMVGAGAGAALAATGAGNIDPNAEGSITIHKYEGSEIPGLDADGTEQPMPEGSKPLAGVKFKACKVNGLSVTDSADWAKITDLNTKINDEKKHTFPTDIDGVTLSEDCMDGTTNEDGLIEWTSVELGVYYVTETWAPSNVTDKVLPFLVTVPMAHNSTGTWTYDVHVYPKNALNELEKDAVDPGALGVGDKIEWTVTNSRPETSQEVTSYVLLDKLDPRLAFVTGSSKITVDGKELTENDDYQVTVANNVVKVAFTQSGLDEINKTRTDKWDIIWTFETTVLSIGDGDIKNQVVAWVNNPGGEWEDGEPSDPASSKWGAVKIAKTDDKSGAALEGAIFQVFGSEADATACVAAVKAAKGTLADGCANAITVYRDADGKEIAAGQDKFTTGEDGVVLIPGLNVGINATAERDYWLVEIVAPAGYLNAETSYPVKVAAGSTTEAVTKAITNTQVPPTTLPNTGAIVSGILIVAAIALGGGCIFLIASSRRKANQA